MLLLSTSAGVRLSEVAIRQQAGGVSCGLSGGAWRYFSEPTPGAVNAAQSYDELMDAARLDRRGAVDQRGFLRADGNEHR